MPVMEIYLFVSETYPSLRAFTSDETGGTLPADYAPWQALKGGALTRRPGKRPDPIVAAIARDGFFLVAGNKYRGHALRTETGAPSRDRCACLG
jgi:hypothetical protein